MLKISNHICFPDTSDALKQVEKAFAHLAASDQEGQGKLELIGELSISIRLSGPFVASSKPKRGSYHKPTETYYIEAYADYPQWIALDWRQRVGNYADALRDAIGRVAKTRLIEAERMALLTFVDRLAEAVAVSPPSQVMPLKSISLIYSGDSLFPGIAFDGVTGLGSFVLPDTRYVEIAPEDAAAVAANLPRRAPEAPPSFKLYKRDNGVLHYHEAWAHEGEITEHWGVVAKKAKRALTITIHSTAA